MLLTALLSVTALIGAPVSAPAVFNVSLGGAWGSTEGVTFKRVLSLLDHQSLLGGHRDAFEASGLCGRCSTSSRSPFKPLEPLSLGLSRSL